jgi:hypothetical protein
MTLLTGEWAAVPTIFSTVSPLGIFYSQVSMNGSVKKEKSLCLWDLQARKQY